ncbi:hypothetical protein [Hydrogenophaga sp.]|uniref:hypothetical protein n=1 Tax=Hydrogenophaga sp. TaxID=1904254 RepID=UPI0025C1FAFE|nr:hypothetical protein [Hydrogenophaga sp.]MBT9465383.1 hypothetical protein [Hydrogenophaga sp.]
MEFTTNTTSQASAGSDGSPSTPFTWQNPVFPMPSPRAHRANPDRLPGVLYSHAPRWTLGKHARILAQIKATRTDLDPSFPRPAAAAEATAPADAGYQLSELISNFAQATKSYFDSLTAYALEQLYEPDLPAATSPGTHPTPAPTGTHATPTVVAQPKDSESQRAKFIDILRKAGMTKDQAMSIVVAWTANNIPLNVHAAPRFCDSTVEFGPDEKIGSSSGASLVYYKTEEGERVALKCYSPMSKRKSQLSNQMTGIDPQNPKFEARCLLASHIAHNILGWDIIPQASMGYFGGRACVMSPRVAGNSLESLMTNNMALHQAFVSMVREGVFHMDQWNDLLTLEFKRNYARLLVFNVLVGDCDRHFKHFIVNKKDGKIDSVKSIDWDMSFGSKKTGDDLHVYMDLSKDQKNMQWTSIWPSSIPKGIADEFGKVNGGNLRKAAEIFELSDEEISALMSRFELIKKKLAAIKKT